MYKYTEKDFKEDAMFQNVSKILKEMDANRVWLEFEGSGDEGMIQMSVFENTETCQTVGLIDNCSYEHAPSPDIWVEEGNITVETTIEKFVEGNGWVKENITKELPWSKVIIDLACLAMDEEIGEWEVNEGSFGHMIVTENWVTIWQTRRIEVEDEDGYRDEYEECVGEFCRPLIDRPEPGAIEEVDEDDDDDTSDEE